MNNKWSLLPKEVTSSVNFGLRTHEILSRDPRMISPKQAASDTLLGDVETILVGKRKVQKKEKTPQEGWETGPPLSHVWPTQ